eukprot:1146079-Pelagomonas_calceolata.AAC.10
MEGTGGSLPNAIISSSHNLMKRVLVRPLIDSWSTLLVREPYKGYKGKRPQSRRLTAGLFTNAH